MSRKKGKASIREENVDRDMDGMYWGVVYIYINMCLGPQFGWVYIGITTNEHGRIIKWFNPNVEYSGRKINVARQEYGINNFRYDVLQRVSCATVKELLSELKRLERYYINLYDATRKGYNINNGGVGSPAVAVLIEDALGNTTLYESMVAAGSAIGLKEGSIRYWIQKQQPTPQGYTIKAA